MRLPASISKLAFLLLTARALPAATMLETLNHEIAGLYDKSKDAIVKIHAEYTPVINGFALRPVHRVGTGFFTDADGHLLTSATVIEDSQSCWVELRGQRVPATVVGRDTAANLAVLKIDTAKPVAFLKQGDSGELRVGSLVVAIGFPYELPSAPIVGFVSGFDIQQGGRSFVTSHIRASCKLRPGQGGGPLLNAKGEVVGIAVAARVDDQCYGLPINAARKVCADLIAHGAVQYGWVGLSVGERRPETADGEPQVVVQQILSNTPAALIGFREMDILVRIGTNRVSHTADVVNMMFHCRQGDRLNFTVLRGGLEQHLTLVVGARPPEETAARLKPGQINTLPITPAAGSR